MKWKLHHIQTNNLDGTSLFDKCMNSVCKCFRKSKEHENSYCTMEQNYGCHSVQLANTNHLLFKCNLACVDFVSVAASANNFIDIYSDLDVSCTKLISYVNSVRNAVEINHYSKPNASVAAGSANLSITTNSATDQETNFPAVNTTLTISLMIEFYELYPHNLDYNIVQNNQLSII